ncbi:MAG TPA: hypothetical protein VD816_04160 [Ohtaekwangia sp.]|nr:hypothetical protein [Ohtaekwangia sp.]
MYAGLIAALMMALLFTVIAVFFFQRRGPWGSSWTFFIVLFLALWIVSIYVRSVGPIYWGIAWVPFFLVGLVVSILLVAIIPNAGRIGDGDPDKADPFPVTEEYQERNVRTGTTGKFFWILVLIMVMAIVVGMLNPQMAL